MPDGMSSRNPPDDKLLLAELIAAIGKTGAGKAERAWFEDRFRTLKQNYQNRLPAYERGAEFRNVMRRFLANAEERNELRRLMEAFTPELTHARHVRLRHASEEALDALRKQGPGVLGEFTDPKAIALAEHYEEIDIRTRLEFSDDYRKDPVRVLILEPALMLLRNEDVLSEEMEAPYGLPLAHMVDALLDYLGIPRKRRPPKSSIRTITLDLRRDFEKRPSQRPRS